MACAWSLLQLLESAGLTLRMDVRAETLGSWSHSTSAWSLSGSRMLSWGYSALHKGIKDVSVPFWGKPTRGDVSITLWCLPQDKGHGKPAALDGFALPYACGGVFFWSFYVWLVIIDWFRETFLKVWRERKGSMVIWINCSVYQVNIQWRSNHYVVSYSACKKHNNWVMKPRSDWKKGTHLQHLKHFKSLSHNTWNGFGSRPYWGGYCLFACFSLLICK